MWRCRRNRKAEGNWEGQTDIFEHFGFDVRPYLGRYDFRRPAYQRDKLFSQRTLVTLLLAGRSIMKHSSPLAKVIRDLAIPVAQ